MLSRVVDCAPAGWRRKCWAVISGEGSASKVSACACSPLKLTPNPQSARRQKLPAAVLLRIEIREMVWNIRCTLPDFKMEGLRRRRRAAMGGAFMRQFDGGIPLCGMPAFDWHIVHIASSPGFSSESPNVYVATAGLLARLVLGAFPPRFERGSGFMPKTTVRLTAAGTAPDSHRVPYYPLSFEQRHRSGGKCTLLRRGVAAW